jgi:hypothetical protein
MRAARSDPGAMRSNRESKQALSCFEGLRLSPAKADMIACSDATEGVGKGYLKVLWALVVV